MIYHHKNYTKPHDHPPFLYHPSVQIIQINIGRLRYIHLSLDYFLAVNMLLNLVLLILTGEHLKMTEQIYKLSV